MKAVRMVVRALAIFLVVAWGGTVAIAGLLVLAALVATAALLAVLVILAVGILLVPAVPLFFLAAAMTENGLQALTDQARRAAGRPIDRTVH